MSNDNTSKKALKSGVWYTLSNFLINGAAFITTPFFARLLTKTEYGEYKKCKLKACSKSIIRMGLLVL